MLSIIISSYKPDQYLKVEENIRITCGLDYEIVKIENPGLMGICEAYNLGAARSKFPCLLFLHDDVEFETLNWGPILIDELSLPNCGIVGVAGSKYYPFPPIGWWELNTESVRNYTQWDNGAFYRYDIDRTTEVEVLDGVFLAMKKEVFDKHSFDATNKGFHAYDIDISLAVSKGFENYVTKNIMIKHFSNGNADLRWFNAMIESKERRSDDREGRATINRKHEGYALFAFYQYLKKFNSPRELRWKILKKMTSFRYLGLVGIFTFLKYYITTSEKKTN